MDKAEKILEDEWGKEKAKSMVEGYHRFEDKDSKHPDSCQNIGTFLEGLKGFRNQIKKKADRYEVELYWQLWIYYLILKRHY